jgi:phosphoribosyl-dephospho-CoA transferase
MKKYHMEVKGLQTKPKKCFICDEKARITMLLSKGGTEVFCSASCFYGYLEEEEE